MEESCVQLLTPKRRINILRDAIDNKNKSSNPYTIVFCGVNGVGKSTNLAKVSTTFFLNFTQIVFVYLRVLINDWWVVKR